MHALWRVVSVEVEHSCLLADQEVGCVAATRASERNAVRRARFPLQQPTQRRCSPCGAPLESRLCCRAWIITLTGTVCTGGTGK